MNTIRCIVVLALLVSSSYAHSYQSCQNVYDPYWGVYRTQCTVGVNFSRFQVSAFQSQHQSQWCWAASISMLFAHAGYSVDQQQIVADAYGRIVDLPAQGWQLAQNLNRTWMADDGRTFSSTLTGLYDVQQGVVNITDNRIINQLSNGNPLIIGSNGHAMVLTEVSYYLNSIGSFDGYAYAAVFDPWPGRGARFLSGSEFTRADLGIGGTLQFLASVSIRGTGSGTPVNTQTGGSSNSFSDEIGAANFGTSSIYLLVLFVAIRRFSPGNRQRP